MNEELMNEQTDRQNIEQTDKQNIQMDGVTDEQTNK